MNVAEAKVLERSRSAMARVLIVEDEMIVSMLFEDMLEELGYEPVGPAAGLEDAIAIANEAEIEAAILDINLNGKDTQPVAAALLRRGIPFLFATGYGAGAMTARFGDVPVLQKPFELHQLARALEAVLSRPAAA